MLRLLDTYVCKLALKVAALTFVGLLGIFYISTFIDLSDKLFKGQTTAAMLAEFFYYKTPEFIFFIIPLTVLIGVMVTIGILTKNSELVVMQACGISLYRVAVPMVLLAIVASGSMFLLQDRVLPYSNRTRAGAAPRDPRRHAADLRRHQPEVADGARRQHLQLHVLRSAAPRAQRPVDLRVRQDARRSRDGASMSGGRASCRHRGQTWRSANGWVREFTKGTDLKTFVTFPARDLALEAPEYFATEVGRARPDDVRAAQALHRGSVGQRRQRRAADGGAVPQGLVSRS